MSGHPLRLQLRASPVLTFLTVGLHALTAAVLWFLLPFGAGLPLAVLVCALGAVAVGQRALLWTANAPAVLGLNRDGSLSIRLRGGREFEGIPADRRYITRWLVILELVCSRQANRTILVASDMLSTEQFRQLRLWALWRALPDEPPAAGA